MKRPIVENKIAEVLKSHAMGSGIEAIRNTKPGIK